MKKLLILALIAAAALSLGACGKKGDIKPPVSHGAAAD